MPKYPVSLTRPLQPQISVNLFLKSNVDQYSGEKTDTVFNDPHLVNEWKNFVLV